MNTPQLDLENIHAEEEEKTSSDSSNEESRPVAHETRQVTENDETEPVDHQSEDDMIKNFIKDYKSNEGGPYEN